MRIPSLPLLTLLTAACATLPSQNAEPALRVVYAGLDLATRDGRADLRRRVRVEVETFCRFHRREVVPQVATRFDLHYCNVTARDTIMRHMPEQVRDAYRSALEEGGGGTL